MTDADPVAPHERSVGIRDGRRLAYLEVGDPSGRPVIYCHGGLSSSLDVVPAGPAAGRLGLRIVAANRPGVGRSTRCPGRTPADWSTDVAALADRLDLGSFGVLGWSLGGAFAQAVAAGLGDRVTRLVLVASTIPASWPGMTDEINRLDRAFLAIRGRGAPIERNLVRAMRSMARRAPGAMARASHLPPEVAPAITAAVAEGLRQAAGVVDEYRCMGGPWGFEPEALRVPTAVWQGDADDLVPSSWGPRLADAIDGSTRHPVPGGTHFLAYDRWDQILGDLAM